MTFFSLSLIIKLSSSHFPHHSYSRFSSSFSSSLLILLLPHKFINSSSHPNLSIPPLPYFYQFLLLLIFINSSSHPNLSIPLPPYFYQFLFPLKFINSSSHPNLSIPPPPYFYQFLLLLIFINSSFSSLFFSIPFLVQIHFSFPDSNRYCNLKWNKLS